MSAASNRRKHRNQMNLDEIIFVENIIHSQPRWTIGKHAGDRAATKDIPREQVHDVLLSGYVVEVNENNDLCVVFRKEYSGYAVCVVVSLRTRWVVTVWKNNTKDKHTSLNQENYLWDVDMTQVMEAFA